MRLLDRIPIELIAIPSSLTPFWLREVVVAVNATFSLIEGTQKLLLSTLSNVSDAGWTAVCKYKEREEERERGGKERDREREIRKERDGDRRKD
jgi:hypothetical protein